MKKSMIETPLKKAAVAAGLTVAMFVPLAIVGGPALAHTGAAASQYQYSCASHFQYRYNPNKVLLWHETHSQKHPRVLIYVNKHAEPAHLRHGDTEATDVTCAPTDPPASTSAEHHGRGHAYGKSKEHGNSSEVHGNSAGVHGNSANHDGEQSGD